MTAQNGSNEYGTIGGQIGEALCIHYYGPGIQAIDRVQVGGSFEVTPSVSGHKIKEASQSLSGPTKQEFKERQMEKEERRKINGFGQGYHDRCPEGQGKQVKKIQQMNLTKRKKHTQEPDCI